MSYLEDWTYTIKKALHAVRDWADDSPVHLAILAAAIFLVPYYWKALLWYLVFPGSFVATYAVIVFIKKYVTK